MVMGELRMKSYNIILASNSPRRKELLSRLGVPFEVRVLKDIDESYPADTPVSEVRSEERRVGKEG